MGLAHVWRLGPALDLPGLSLPQKVQVVVFGHSHQPLARRQDRVLWFNPGSAGPKRFSLPVSVGWLEIEGGRVRHRLIRLRG